MEASHLTKQIMIKIVDYKTRESDEGKPFIALIVESGVEMVKSENTGKFYATKRRASFPSTFNEEETKALIGAEISGTIQKVQCQPYEYTSSLTEEIIMLSHTYTYVPEPQFTSSNSEERHHNDIIN
jgi:hypothetical protein